LKIIEAHCKKGGKLGAQARERKQNPARKYTRYQEKKSAFLRAIMYRHMNGTEKS
jgi:hypothetical protein